MDELLDVLDDQGKYTGETILKSEAHRTGVFHATVHIWFYTKTSYVLIQQRGRNKKTFPSLWDVSVAGHIEAGESTLAASLREIKEEIGLTLKSEDLQKIGVYKAIKRHSETLIDCEFHHTYLTELKVPFEDLKKQESEVAALALVHLSELPSLIVSEKFVPNENSYYTAIINAIQESL